MSFSNVTQLLVGKKGIEFGGPTQLFQNQMFNMELYKYVSLDGGNIMNNNHFQYTFSDNYNYGGKIGKQFNIDCTNEIDLKLISEKYDFIVTSHVIEHIANPIKTLKLWGEYILKDTGLILSIIPDYRFCFDRNRPLTTINHLIEDYKNNVTEDDDTHIEEQKLLHDWSYGGHKDFNTLCNDNGKTRVVHHHTFIEETFNLLLKESGYETILSFKHDDLNIVNIAKKT